MTVAGAKNVMESRVLAKGSLEYFPTPPWATRAVIKEVLQAGLHFDLRSKRVRDPCAGGGHMSAPLGEIFAAVDVADWGVNPEIRDFLEETPQRLIEDGHQLPDWIFINPPFEQAVHFVLRALEIATEGVAVFCRLGWLSSQSRYDRLFGWNAPAYVCPFSERVSLIQGAWDPDTSSATDYAWYIWIKDHFPSEARPRSTVWHLQPGMQERYTRLSDMDLATPGEAERRRLAKKKAEAANVATPSQLSLLEGT
ncbi:SAM-dependent DNA methyltransferase [Rhizobium ruizarguesonis]|uniref:Methyltransferase n=2 Tax=Rhizobium TaxID=379 RepID=A0A179BJI2_RHILE|nr:hypothetical protein [Rhizobium leguminosarum]OAP91271.1 hypothetical protein A4U53_27810 [Rhizobium leguminosarum]